MSAQPERYQQIMPEPDADTSSALAQWFSVSGDMDDFIFYNDPEPRQSER